MSSSDESVLRQYTLVRFVHRGRKRKVEEIDVVPTSWLYPDTSKRIGRCMTKYVTFDNEEDKKLLHDLVETATEAPEDWPIYPVEIVGRAGIFFDFL